MGSTTRTILVTGGTGFIGGWTVRELRRILRDRAARDGRDATPALRLLIHRRPAARDCVADTAVRLECEVGDLADPASLDGICDGVDTVVHLAAKVGDDPALAYQVNVAGTRNLLAEARRAGVGRIIQLGTAAVYRDGVHRGAAEGELETGPASVTSRSRLAGEEMVLAAGGTVLRPHLVYGTGDVWVVPALAYLMRRLPHWVEGGRARISLVAVDDLARAIAALALGPAVPAGPAGRVLHASHPVPVTTREVLTTLAGALQLPLPAGDLTVAQAMELLGGPAPVWERRLSLLAVDHWYDSSALWELSGCEPGPGFGARFADHAPWYRAALSKGTA